MDLSIIIPEYKTTELTQQLLDNLKEATSWSYETEVIVVQDGDDYPYAKQVTDGPLVTTFYPLCRHGGFAAATNKGIEQTTGDYVAIFNNDMTVSPWWDDILIRTLQEKHMTSSNHWHPYYGYRLGMVSGEIFQAENHPPYLEPGEMTQLQEVTVWNKGAPWVFPRRVFDKVGLFDEQFYPGNFEETDLFLRMAMAGYVHGSVPNVRCLHRRHGTLGTQWTQREFWQLYHDNRSRFIDKWGGEHIDYDRALHEKIALRAE